MGVIAFLVRTEASRVDPAATLKARLGDELRSADVQLQVEELDEESTAAVYGVPS